MNDPQIWTLIGVSGALFFAMGRQLSSSIRSELRAGLDRIDATMDARFTDVDHRLESLEGDMRIIKAHLIGQSTITQARG